MVAYQPHLPPVNRPGDITPRVELDTLSVLDVLTAAYHRPQRDPDAGCVVGDDGLPLPLVTVLGLSVFEVWGWVSRVPAWPVGEDIVLTPLGELMRRTLDARVFGGVS